MSMYIRALFDSDVCRKNAEIMLLRAKEQGWRGRTREPG
jgi:hypothetical protein